MIANSTARARFLRAAALSLAGAFAAGGCDFIDPTQVENPRTTEEDLARAEQPTAALVAGLRARFAEAIGDVVTVTENVSDNYSVQSTGLNKVLDTPRSMLPNQTGGIYFGLQELRALASFVLDEIAPEDETATAELLAEAQYYRGMAYVLLAENFVGAPLEIDGPLVLTADLLARAIADFNGSLERVSDGDFSTPALAGLARAYRLAGDADQAENYANRVLAADPELVFAQGFDENSVDNGPHNFLVQRSLQEMQPLPRLDFLDPKYLTEEDDIPVAKAEEMHLILAEAAMGRGAWAAGRDHLADAIELALDRTTETFEDDDLRKNADLTIRPRHSDIRVRADENAPFRTGLVLDRPDFIDVPIISSTSLDADSIGAIPASNEQALLHALFLARQEIFFLEGRRMSDLGIRLPIMRDEIDTNASIADGDPGTEPMVPEYIPDRDLMDIFTPKSPYEETEDPTKVVKLADTDITILFDMNRILAENRVLPLFP